MGCVTATYRTEVVMSSSSTIPATLSMDVDRPRCWSRKCGGCGDRRLSASPRHRWQGKTAYTTGSDIQLHGGINEEAPAPVWRPGGTATGIVGRAAGGMARGRRPGL